MQRSDFRFLERLRVRWAEIDAQKIVFNGHYLMYFDTADRRLLARAGDAVRRDDGTASSGDLFVRKATIEYDGLGALRRRARRRHALRPHRHLVDGLRRRRLPRRAAAGAPASWSTSSPIRTTQRSKPVPRELRELFDGFERGEADGRRARSAAGPSSAPTRGRSAPRSSSTSRRSRPRWNGTTPTPTAVHAVAYNRLGAGAGHRPAARARAPASPRSAGWRWPATLARQRRRPGGARGAARGGARPRRRARRCCMRRLSAAGSTSAPASCRRGPAFDEAGIAHVRDAARPLSARAGRRQPPAAVERLDVAAAAARRARLQAAAAASMPRLERARRRRPREPRQRHRSPSRSAARRAIVAGANQEARRRARDARCRRRACSASTCGAGGGAHRPVDPVVDEQLAHRPARAGADQAVARRRSPPGRARPARRSRGPSAAPRRSVVAARARQLHLDQRAAAARRATARHSRPCRPAGRRSPAAKTSCPGLRRSRRRRTGRCAA